MTDKACADGSKAPISPNRRGWRSRSMRHEMRAERSVLAHASAVEPLIAWLAGSVALPPRVAARADDDPSRRQPTNPVPVRRGHRFCWPVPKVWQLAPDGIPVGGRTVIQSLQGRLPRLSGAYAAGSPSLDSIRAGIRGASKAARAARLPALSTRHRGELRRRGSVVRTRSKRRT